VAQSVCKIHGMIIPKHRDAKSCSIKLTKGAATVDQASTQKSMAFGESSTLNSTKVAATADQVSTQKSMAFGESSTLQ
jgi:hypothetical protein